MENWCYNPKLWLYLTQNRWFNGICAKIKESASFQEGLDMRQLSFGLLDMGWHGQDQQQLQM
jgi:peptidyl-dipeptidase Dcp